jgi:hypothetical protein
VAAPTTVQLSPNSAYLRTPVYSVGGALSFGIRREIILPDATDRVVTVTQPLAGRLDLIAYELYGSSDFWWVLCDLNQIADPMTEIAAGTELRVAQQDRVLNAVNSSNQ